MWNSAKQLKVAVTLSQQTLPHCSLIPRCGALTICPPKSQLFAKSESYFSSDYAKPGKRMPL